jgi:site-specific recombinase XerD
MTVTFSYLVTRFFVSHLANEKKLAENTIASYSDCMRLLIEYACRRFEVAPDQIGMDSFSTELILDFLDALESERNNVESTRNQRLAAIKAFFQFLARTVPELMHLNECIQAIRPKSTEHNPPPSLTRTEVDAIIARPDPATLIGARDKALIQMLYNTGARVQEIADLRIADLRTAGPPTVTLTGKGRKQRVVPLWQETVDLIGHYLQTRKQAGIESEHLFLNHRAVPMTRFGIGRRVALHAESAGRCRPSLRDRSITPHVFRHTTALHLVEAGNDITVVRDWLGHADLKTTSQYIEVSIERKRAALDKVPTPASSTETPAATWQTPSLIQLLTKLSRSKHYVT